MLDPARLSEAAQHLLLLLTAALPKITVGLAILFAAWIASVIVYRLLARMTRRAPHRRELWELAAESAHLAILAFGAVTAFGTMGIDVSALVASLGLVGFALGFAFRDVVSNVLSGVLIMLYEPFVVGQEVTITGVTGRVSRIDLRYTTIETEEGHTLIPNSNCFSNPIAVKREGAAMDAAAE